MRLRYSVFLMFCIVVNRANTIAQQKVNNSELLKYARNEVERDIFDNAISKYLQLLKSDSTNATYNMELGQAYYYSFRQPASISYFKRAMKYSKDSLSEAYYFLANSYHLVSAYDFAKKYYSIYLGMLKRQGTQYSRSHDVNLKSEIQRKIEMCDNGLKATANSKILIQGKEHSFQVSNLGISVNSIYDDYDAVLSTDDSAMYFTSRRSDNTEKKLDVDEKYFEDIFTSNLSKIGWSKAHNIGAPINTGVHEGVIAVSKDNKTLYFFRGNNSGNFYSSIRAGDSWTNPKEFYLSPYLDKMAWEPSFFGLPSDNEIYLVSDRKGGLGKRDIYVSRKSAGGSWSPFKNLGSKINTPYEEDAVFITPDKKTMYFSSEGHNSIGGFDIFKSERIGDTLWSEAVNLGTPINTPGNDIYFIYNNSGDKIYFSSSAQNGHATRDLDIYQIDLCDDIQTTTIVGVSKGINNGSLSVFEKNSAKDIGPFNITNASYSIQLKHGKSYRFTLSTNGIAPVTAEIAVPSQCKSYNLYQEIQFMKAGSPILFKNAFFDIAKEAEGKPNTEYLNSVNKKSLSNYNEVTVATTPTIVVAATTTTITTPTTTTMTFNNVLFDFNKSNINDEYKSELDKAVEQLKAVEGKGKIEVAGYTDSKGSDNYNLALSKRRAEAVANYLISKGVSNSKIKFVGYGKSRPISPNENPDGTDNPDGRARNRRTEIIVEKL